jgi:spore maturation protein CgeB
MGAPGKSRMSNPSLSIVILGLSITSSWGNGHATTYRGLVRELVRRGHDVLFLERDVPWYAQNRDLPQPPYGRTLLYGACEELRDRYSVAVRDADAVIVGSFVPDGAAVGDWVIDTARGVRAFYDIDTPVTLARLARGEHDYLRPDQIARYDLYLSFTGGPTLRRIEREFGAPAARALYCSVDPDLYFPEPATIAWDLAYMGTYSSDRQPAVNALLLEPARLWPQGRFAIAGPQYPDPAAWPGNVLHIPHLPPDRHRGFYNGQRYTLNVTRADMIQAGWSPSVRLFEAAACATPILSDDWPGLEEIFTPGREIFLVRSGAEVLRVLRETTEDERRAIAERSRARVTAEHTAAHRARDLERHLVAALEAAPA